MSPEKRIVGRDGKGEGVTESEIWGNTDSSPAQKAFTGERARDMEKRSDGKRRGSLDRQRRTHVLRAKKKGVGLDDVVYYSGGAFGKGS